MEPLEDETAELARAYRYCKLFHCSVSEYESRPSRETTWLLKIDETYQEAKAEVDEAANKR
jgi:hypothetical protein